MNDNSVHTKIRRPPRRHNLAVRHPLEKNRLVARSGRVAEGADGLGRLVLVGGEQVVEALVAERGEEPFTGWRWLIRTWRTHKRSKRSRGGYMYGPGRPFKALKQRQVSSTRTGPPT
jgi:hypothetical protein